MPFLVSRAHAYLEEVNEFVAGPPDYEEFYSERSLKFGRLGVASLKLAQDLRVRHGAAPSISSFDPEDEYDLELHLQQIVSDVLRSKQAAERSVTDC